MTRRIEEIILFWRICHLDILTDTRFTRFDRYHNNTDGSPDTLQEAQVLAMSQADCVDIHEGSGRPITDDMICVGHDNDIYTGSCYVTLLINYIKSPNPNEVFRIHTTSKS